MVTTTRTDIRIDTKNVCRYLGYCSDCEPGARISSLIEEYAEEAQHLMEPSYTYVFRDIEWVQGSCVFLAGSGSLLSNLVVFDSEVVAGLLSQCRKVAVLVVSIGDHLEDMVCRLSEDGLMLQASVLDAIGSEAVEKLADTVQNSIAGIAGDHGMVVSRRFSPGYCDWDVSQQLGVFRIVDGDSVGVKLTETGLMVPRKSMSGIMGMGASDSGVREYNPCKTCDRSDCCGRR